MGNNLDLKNELTLMFALDLSQMDKVLLQYAGFLSTLGKIKHFHFVHNIKKSQLYDLYNEFLEDDITIEDIIRQELNKTIKENYKGNSPHTLTITSENYTESSLVQLSKEFKVSLMVLGHKSEMQGTGALPQKLVRMLQANLLLVPEETKHQLKKILVPTDFSANSGKSLETARSIMKITDGEIELLHVYNIPSFYFPYINTEKAMDKTKEHISEKIAQFRKRYQLEESIYFREIDREEDSIVEVIEKNAESRQFDIIVVSARGANTITSLFIGGVTNDLLISDRKMPLLVVK